MTFMLWLSDQGSAIVFLLFALSVPMYAIYGVANGRLMRAGRSFLGMLASAIPAFLSFVFLALPIGNFLERAAWGNLVGAIVMAFVTSQFSRHILDQSPVVPVGKVVVQAIAIFAVSAINIASPIIDRFFANAFGPEELVLLNLGAILYIGAVTSLGMAMGNAAVSRASVNGNEFSTGAITTIPLIVGAAFFGVTPIFVSMVLAGGGYGENGSGVLTAVCFVYAISTPCAILNQVYMRLWNRVAPARSMIVIAVLLLVLNVAGNWFFVLKFGVVGIAVSTLFVQVIQSIVLGVLRKNRTPVLMVVLCTTVAGGVLIATS
ncbi:O-antigen/teichoic acid export membrane protein [Arthrobacter ginsengisoli]|uniref:O-antigen/teichoic acid export membrane protein n=1 Tax=Arthrobacter ginsengisoli TaxID=1356565 RepID=A0ABU1UDB7_9MICC|nr:hypothetical protein [Arthrobacter ginsengisoli]MDR7083177.1 O-antigen/teichoic acid export membrane protein [Arthrobacter ginsengisoli]